MSEPETGKIEDSVDKEKVKMTVFEAVSTRRSIRKFTSQDVPMQILGVVLDAGRYAPSAGNLQNWRFILVKEDGIRQRIAESAQQQMWIAQAPIIIVVCAETEKISMHYGVRGERLYSVQNCAAAIQNMLLTAHSLGLASTWIGAFDEDMLRRAVNIPGNVRPQAILPIGYPDEVVPSPSRYTLENVCFYGSYGNRISNIERVLQNPKVFDKLGGFISGIVKPVQESLKKKKKK